MPQLTGQQIAALITAFTVAAAAAFGYLVFGSANSSVEAADLLAALRGWQAAYSAAGYQYGAAALNSAVITNSHKVDPAIVSGTDMLSRWGTKIIWTGAGTNLVAALTAVPNNNCVEIMTDASLAPVLVSIGITSGTARVPGPNIDPATAATDCGSSGTVALTATFNGHP